MTSPIEQCIFSYVLNENYMIDDSSYTEELHVWSSGHDKIEILAFATDMAIDDVVITLDKQNALALANAINKHFGGKHE